LNLFGEWLRFSTGITVIAKKHPGSSY